MHFECCDPRADTPSRTHTRGITQHHKRGVGNETSNLFTISSSTAHWDLTWSYSCPTTAPTGVLGRFVFLVYRYNSVDKKDPGADRAGYDGQGTQHYADTGSFSIHARTAPTCVWDLIAVIPDS